jgi:hypothetical protein
MHSEKLGSFFEASKRMTMTKSIERSTIGLGTDDSDNFSISRQSILKIERKEDPGCCSLFCSMWKTKQMRS